MKFDKSKFIAQYKTETAEHVQKISDGLIGLERDFCDRGLREAMMREAHSIKGSSTMMGFKRVADIANEMEDGFELTLKQGLVFEKRHFDQIFKCLDAITPLLEDKVLWDDAGVAYPYVQELCDETRQVFLTQDSLPVAVPIVMSVQNTEAHGSQEQVGEVKTVMLPLKEATSIRVGLEEIDRLVNLSGELLIAKTRLEQVSQVLVDKMGSCQSDAVDFLPLAKDLQKVTALMSKATATVRHEVMNLRLFPVSVLFRQFPRAIRDLAAANGKTVHFSIIGEDTRLDKAILDDMKDPLMHLLRNAVDHGIECGAERLKKNKPQEGQLCLHACQRGSQVIIEVADDGKGIDVAAVKKRAVAQGLVSAESASEMSDEQACQLLFVPGFTTSNTVSMVSGRGVGLDVVRERVAKYKGLVEVEQRAEGGTRFVLKLPLTLAVTECLIVSAGPEDYAIPIDAVVETLRVPVADIKTVEAKEVIATGHRIIPLVRVTDLFSLATKGIMERRFASVIVVQALEDRLALMVDRIVGRQEIVSKPFGAPLAKVKNMAGATILGSGRVVLLLDIPSIIETAGGVMVRKPKVVVSAPRVRKRKTILLAEDTLSTAMLEKNVLESVGYAVVLARDGVEALEKAANEKFDLVITDILMPRMDGFELIGRFRSDLTYKDTPIVVVTTREKAEERKRGLDVGANAYLLKSEFTSDVLLETLERLLG